MQPFLFKCVSDCSGDVFLSRQIGEGLRAIFACDDLIAHAIYSPVSVMGIRMKKPKLFVTIAGREHNVVAAEAQAGQFRPQNGGRPSNKLFAECYFSSWLFASEVV
jgi:hypothetical protein